MAEFEIIAINYEQRRIEYFKQQKAAAERKLKYWMSRKKHVSNPHEWLPIEEKCSECGDLINFYANAIAVFERPLGNEEQRNLAEKLREYAEWAHANEWETPICLGDDLESAAGMIELLKATAEESSAQAAMCDVTMERCDQLQNELEYVKREILFRGKGIDNRDWVEGYLVEKIDADTGLPDVFIVDRYEFSQSEEYNGRMCDSMHIVDPATVGQYTGLKDRNGVRIFEGDVLSTENGTFSNTGMGQIMFRNGIWLSYYGQDALNRDCFDELHAVCNSREVIGNIHDNPELVEV